MPYRSILSIIVMSPLAGMWFASPALAHVIPGGWPEQYTQNCQVGDPRLDRLARAFELGEIDYIRTALAGGLDVNETWRDFAAQACRSLLLRSIWYGKDDIFNLLLKRDADPRTVPDDALQIPVRDGRVAMVRTLLGLGLKLPNKYETVLAALFFVGTGYRFGR